MALNKQEKKIVALCEKLAVSPSLVNELFAQCVVSTNKPRDLRTVANEMLFGRSEPYDPEDSESHE